MTNCRAVLRRVVSLRRWTGRREEGQGVVVVVAGLGVERLRHLTVGWRAVLVPSRPPVQFLRLPGWA